MENKSPIQVLYALVLSFLLTFGSVGIMITAFDFDLGGGPMVLLAVFAVILVVVVGVICSYYRKWGWIFELGSMGLIVLFNREKFMISLEATLNRITVPFHEAYGCGRIRWSKNPLSEGNEKLIWFLVSMLLAWGVAYAVYWNRKKWMAYMPAVFVLGLCIAVPKQIPAVIPVMMTLGSLMLMALLSAIPREKQEVRNGVVRIALAPILLTLTLALIFIPKQGYGSASGNFFADFINSTSKWVNSLSNGGPMFNSGGTITSESVSLMQVGPRKSSTKPVLEVKTNYSGLLYLRGVSYDTYTGKAWRRSSGEWPKDDDYIQMSGNQSVSITSVTRQQVQFQPCHPYIDDGMIFKQGKIFIKNKVPMQYRMLCGRINRIEFKKDYIRINGSLKQYPDDDLESLDMGVMNQYLKLPKTAEKGARKHLAKIESPERNSNLDAEVQEVKYLYDYAQNIRDYVKESAEYDLKTAKMPMGQSDFAMWFLEKSDTGYCAHFATAAAVLLRAVGIPTRYVSGYAVQVKDTNVVVQQRHAHAWVEYWLPGMGWMILEATPSAWRQDISSDGSSQTSSQTSSGTSSQESSSRDESSSPKPSSGQSSSGSSSAHGSSSKPNGPGSQSGGTSSDTQQTGMTIPWNAIGQIILAILQIVGAAAVILGQWKLRVWYKHRRMYWGNPNQQARVRWKYCKWYGRLLGERMPERLTDLTRKAQFSQHTLTEQELTEFDDYLIHVQARMRRKPVIYRMVYRLILAVY